MVSALFAHPYTRNSPVMIAASVLSTGCLVIAGARALTPSSVNQDVCEIFANNIVNLSLTTASLVIDYSCLKSYPQSYLLNSEQLKKLKNLLILSACGLTTFTFYIISKQPECLPKIT